MRSRSARARFVLSLLFLAAAGVGCGAKQMGEHRSSRPKPKLKAETSAKPPATIKGPQLLPSFVVAKVDDQNNAPLVARRGDDALLFYNAGGSLVTRLCDKTGAPKGPDPVEVARSMPTLADMPFSAIEAVSDGYVAAWVELQKGNATIKAVELDAQGRAKGPAIALAQSADDVSWMEIIATKTNALVVWEIPREDHFDVLAAPVTKDQAARSTVILAHDALAWDVVATERGGAIATVVAGASAPGAAGSEDSHVGRVLYADIDIKGKLSAPLTVNAEPTAQSDIVIARSGKNTILTWTDVREIDTSVFVAAVSPEGTLVSPPKRATSPLGEQALVSFVSGKGESPRALLAWEDLLHVPVEGRLVHLAAVGPDATLSKERATLLFSSSGPPDITADGDGFAVMTLAPAAEGPAQTPVDAPIWPMFVRFDKNLTPLASEPIRAAPFAASEGTPYLTRGLTCHDSACLALASSGGSPSTLAMVALPIRQSSWNMPAWRDQEEAPPHPRSVTALYDGDHLAKVASTPLPTGGALVGWTTYFIEGSDAATDKPSSKSAEPLATASVRPIAADGTPGKTLVLSQRALSIGGIALSAAAQGKTQESAVVWANREKSESQIQIAKLGAGAEKLAQKALTTVRRKPSKDGVPSEVSDVAIAYAPATDPGKGSDDGWVVSWVDTRDGNAEVYAARVDRTLRKVVTDHRITETPGDSAEVQVVTRGKETILVWSDARQNPDEGNGDIYMVRLDTRTLQKVGPESRIFASAAHSRTPVATLAGDRVVIAWIEEPASSSSGPDPDAGVRIAVIDERGQLTAPPRLVHGKDGSAVTSVTLTCTSTRCRGVLTSQLRDSMTLDAFDLAPGAPVTELRSLVSLTGGVNADASPSFAGTSGSWLFFGDDAVSGAGRVRFMNIGWERN